MRRTALLPLLIAFAFVAVPHGCICQTAPDVSITNPSENDIVGIEVHVEGTASATAKGVEIKIDASDLWWDAELAGGVWSYLWNTTGVTKDYHTIYARGYNGTVKSDTESVRVYVDNTPPASIDTEASLSPEETRPGKNVTVTGFAEYDTSVKVAKASVKVEILGQGVEVETVTGADGYFSATIAAPGYAGDYTVRTTVSDGSMAGHDDDELRVRDPDQPDLEVSSITIEPEEPRDGEEITITARVDNLGVQEASTRVKFYIDGDLAGSKDITVVDSNTASVTWDAFAGNHTVKAEAADVVPQDKDATNNERSVSIYVRAMSRLELEALVFSHPSPSEGDVITIQVKAVNRGDVTAQGNLVLYLGKPSDDIRLEERRLSVAPNATEFYFFDWTAVEGDHKIYAKAYVDTEDPSQEHEISEELPVGPPPPEPRTTPSAGAAGLVLALVGALIIMRRRAA